MATAIDYKGLGEQLRDEGMARVLLNAGDDWRQQVRAVVCDLAMERETFTIIDVRKRAAEVGVEDPHHENAWGAVMSGCAGKFMVSTGRSVNSPIGTAHARKIQVWQSLLYGDGMESEMPDSKVEDVPEGTALVFDRPITDEAKEAAQVAASILQGDVTQSDEGWKEDRATLVQQLARLISPDRPMDLIMREHPDEETCQGAREDLLKLHKWMIENHGRGLPERVLTFLKWAFDATK